MHLGHPPNEEAVAMNIGSTGRVPGALLGLHGSGTNIYAQSVPIAKAVVKEIGKRAAALALKKAGSRLAGKLFLNSREWIKAFEHIAEHFSLRALATKATHSVFLASLRNKSAVEGLINQALRGPTRKYLWRLKIANEVIPLGRPCVMIEREFAQVIGETFENVGGQFVKKEGADCKWLRIIVDYTGRPITAYPFNP
jgi:hypothetical protein